MTITDNNDENIDKDSALNATNKWFWWLNNRDRSLAYSQEHVFEKFNRRNYRSTDDYLNQNKLELVPLKILKNGINYVTVSVVYKKNGSIRDAFEFDTFKQNVEDWWILKKVR
jgi:hypothetical protein